MSEFIRVEDLVTRHHYTIVATAFDETRHKKVDNPKAYDTALDAQGLPRAPRFWKSGETWSVDKQAEQQAPEPKTERTQK